MEYRVQIIDMPTTIKSFVERQDNYDTIVINAKLSSDQQQACYMHELGHIMRDDLYKADSADDIEKAAHERKVFNSKI